MKYTTYVCVHVHTMYRVYCNYYTQSTAYIVFGVWVWECVAVGVGEWMGGLYAWQLTSCTLNVS